ncbi:MAG: acyl-CoA thioesterase [Candidatus Gastranaerophilales bacterium]|nr:acyl-CoA thioesterase [Candidatus Gastranaerophilales bacterium]
MLYQAETILKVEFYDLDPMNVVWHGNYVKYLEAARCDMLNKLGYNYMDMRNDGFAFPIATVDMKYIKPCVFNQELKVVSMVEEIEPCLIIKYTIFDNKTGEKLFKAKTMQICVDINTQQSVYEAPENLKKKLACCKV